MKRLPLLLAPVLLLAPATADDQTRDVQAALKSQGFYYGEVTGAQNAETDAAIRRFQIRNGVTVTGKMNPGTLAALGLAEKKAPAQQPAPQPAPETKPLAVAKSGPAPAVPAKPNMAAAPEAAQQKQFNPPAPAAQKPAPAPPLKRNPVIAQDVEPRDAAPKTVRIAKGDRSVVEPPATIPPAVSTPLSTMFRDSPYATAPREVQMEVVRRAQAILAERQFYDGKLDGVAGPATSEAIFLFQAKTELRRTGRLDNDTLAELDLLPRAAQGDRLLKPFYNPNRRRDTSVSPDYWLR